MSKIHRPLPARTIFLSHSLSLSGLVGAGLVELAHRDERAGPRNRSPQAQRDVERGWGQSTTKDWQVKSSLRRPSESRLCPSPKAIAEFTTSNLWIDKCFTANEQKKPKRASPPQQEIPLVATGCLIQSQSAVGVGGSMIA